MKSGTAVGPDDIPVEVWKCIGDVAVVFFTRTFNRILQSEKMPEEWRRRVLELSFMNKGDIQSCGSYTGIKLMSHTMKLCGSSRKCSEEVSICEQQYGFMPKKENYRCNMSFANTEKVRGSCIVPL